jgi:uncharacterized membrane protein
MDLDNRDWHYAKDGEQLGPIPFTQLKAMVENGSLPPSSLVWSEGMGNWEPYQKVIGSALDLPATPRPEGTRNETVTDELSSLPVTTEEFTSTQCLQWGWDLTLKKFGTLVGYGALYIVISMALSLVFSMIGGAVQYGLMQTFGPEQWILILSGLINNLLSGMVSVFFALGLLRVGLNIIGGEYITPGTLFSQGHNFVNGVAAYFLFMVIFFVGLVLLVIPGIYFALRCGFFMHAIADRNLGPIEALKYSARLTEGRCMSLLALWILIFLIYLAGALCLLIGLLWALPCIVLAQIFAYRYLQGGYQLILTLEQRRNEPAPLMPGMDGR